MIRRLDVPGGMAKRTMSGPVYARPRVHVPAQRDRALLPGALRAALPAVPVLRRYHVIQWICSDSKKHQTLPRRIWATAGICLALIPLWTVWLGQWWYLRIRDGEAPHRPELSPLAIEAGHATLAASAELELARAPSQVA